MPTPALPEESNLLLSILETVSEPVVVLNDDGVIQLFNPAAEKLSGIPVSEAIGREIWPLVHPDECEQAKALFRRLITGGAGETEGLPVAWLSRASLRLPLVWRTAVVRDEPSGSRWLVCSGHDRTEAEELRERARDLVARDEVRSRREGALRNSEARFSGIVQLSSDAIISIDEDQRITLFNRGAERVFGWSAAEVLGKPLDLLLPPDSRRAHPGHIGAFAQSGVASRPMGERRAITGLRRSGEEFPAEASILKLEVDGELVFTVLLRDVSEQRRATAEQRFLVEFGRVLASSLDLDTTLSSVADLAVGFLADYCVLDIFDPLEGVRRIRSVARKGCDPEPARVLQTMELDRSQPHIMSRCLIEGEPELVRDVSEALLEEVAQSPDHLAALKALRAVSWIAVPLRARNRDLGALLMVASEGRRPYDDKDLELATEIGARAGLAMDSAGLYWEARRAIQARDDILGIVSHDLGNPLQAVFIGLEALERVAERSEKEEYYLSAMRRSAELMQRLIHELLEVRRMEEGRLTLDLADHHLGALVREALEVIDPLARVKSVGLVDHTTEADLPTLRVDGDRILQVLSNLIGNAVKHTPSGGRVEVFASETAEGVLVSVRDTGPGIAAEHLSQVFERFWRAERSGGKGIGLGLAIAKGIVLSHGGRIWVESTEGEGSCFSFLLPVAGVGSVVPGRS